MLKFLQLDIILFKVFGLILQSLLNCRLDKLFCFIKLYINSVFIVFFIALISLFRDNYTIPKQGLSTICPLFGIY